uniref:Uncharacterized protein n=1 Tax=Arundo donax TaxID=35708 RepID=A0A0A9GGU8_ARUDO
MSGCGPSLGSGKLAAAAMLWCEELGGSKASDTAGAAEASGWLCSATKSVTRKALAEGMSFMVSDARQPVRESGHRGGGGEEEVPAPPPVSSWGFLGSWRKPCLEQTKRRRVTVCREFLDLLDLRTTKPRRAA